MPHSPKRTAVTIHKVQNKTGCRSRSFIVSLIGLLLSPAIHAFELSLLAGYSQTQNSSLTFNDPNQQWHHSSSNIDEQPLVTGKLGNWVDNQLRWGWACEISVIPISATLHTSNNSGENTTLALDLQYQQLSINTYYRWFPHIGGFKFEPYIGAGVGAVITRFTISTQNPTEASSGYSSDKYRYTGYAGQLLTGIRFPITNKLTLSMEYKLVYLDSDGDLGQGYSLDYSPLLQIAQAGLSYQF